MVLTQPSRGLDALMLWSSTASACLPSLHRNRGGATSVVTSTTTSTDPYISFESAPTLKPMLAKMRPTSPRGNMPKPIVHLSPREPRAPRAAAIFVMIAMAESNSAIPKTRRSAMARTSVVIPMFKKKIGTKICAIDETSRSTRSCAAMRRSARPATNAPIIGAR